MELSLTAKKLLFSCTLCPNECKINRLQSVGACGVDSLKIAKYYLHPYEEPCISFKNGSGTIFFCGCNLHCPFCQNYEVSRAQRGKSVSVLELTDIFKELEDKGADNISLITPTHVLPYLCDALALYKPKIPVVYNCGGYESVDALKYIDEFVDIWLPDLKFYSPTLSRRYLNKDDYFKRATKALLFMKNKPLKMTEDGKMLSGVIVRHLIMPLSASDSIKIVRWFKAHMGDDAYLSLMSQYTPFGNIENFPELKRKITRREYDEVVEEAISLGIEKLFAQKRDSSDVSYIPTWDF